MAQDRHAAVGDTGRRGLAEQSGDADLPGARHPERPLAGHRGAGERFLPLLEEQTRHEIYLDREQVALAHEATNLEHDLRKRGQTFGLGIGLVALTIGGLLVFFGNPISGTIFGGTGVGSLVGAFLYDRHQTKKDRLQGEE